MKKIFVILLACAMVFAMVACGNNETPSTEPQNPSQGDESTNPGTNTTPGENGATEPSEGSKWATKEMDAPTFEEFELQEQVVTTLEGKDITTSIVQMPIKLADIDITDVKAKLQANPLFKDWTFGTEDYERGLVTLYSDVGQMTGYEWEKSIVATKEYQDKTSYFSDLVVDFQGETQKANGYTYIRMEIEIPEESVTPDIQANILEACKAVFGEEYGEYLCYAPIQEKNLLCEIQLKNATVAFRRGISEYGLTFILDFSPKVNSVFEGYAGNGEYQPLLGEPEYFYDIFSKDFGSCDMSKYKEFGAEMLKPNFTDYAGTLPDYTSGYTYRVLTGDNGHKVVDFDMDGMVGINEVGKLVSPDFVVEYTVVAKDGTVTNTEGKFKVGVGMTDDDADTESTRADYFLRACRCLNAIWAEDDIEFASLFTKDEDGKHQPLTYKTTILGIEKSVSFTFDLGTTMADTMVGYAGFAWSSWY